MKVLAFCVDGLEASLVEKWKLKEFMQNYYGKINVRVAVKPGDPLYTPLIWSAFLLGKPAYLYGLDYAEILKKRLYIGCRIPKFIINIRRKLLGKRKLNLRSALERLGLFDREKIIQSAQEIESLPKEAINDALPEVLRKKGYRVWIKEFPSYNDFQRAKLRGVISNLAFRDDMDILMREEELTKRLFSEAINSLELYDLIIYYTDLIDLANHRFYKPESIRCMMRLASYYKKIERLVMEIKKLQPNLAVIIVSDHGFDPVKQDHGNYGFWSMNLKPPKVPKTILDFKNIIMKLLDA